VPKARRSGVPNPSRGSPGQTLCRHCRRLLSTLEHYSGEYCSAPRCREQHLQDQLEAFRDDTARLVEEPEPTRYAIVVIPHRTGELVPVEPERRRALDDRLSELAAICAGQHATPAQVRNDAPQPVPVVCESCQGACCYLGGNHAAFLDEEAIGAFAAHHPDLTADEIRAAYLRHVPEVHFAGSCVFHTDRGCNLPRMMRAPICNHYECRGLKSARERAQGSHPALFIVARHDNAIVRGEFVDGTAHHGHAVRSQRSGHPVASDAAGVARTSAEEYVRLPACIGD
jgi:hypothetical protein